MHEKSFFASFLDCIVKVYENKRASVKARNFCLMTVKHWKQVLQLCITEICSLRKVWYWYCYILGNTMIVGTIACYCKTWSPIKTFMTSFLLYSDQIKALYSQLALRHFWQCPNRDWDKLYIMKRQNHGNSHRQNKQQLVLKCDLNIFESHVRHKGTSLNLRKACHFDGTFRTK